MIGKQKTNKLERMFCDYSCIHAKPLEDHGACMTFNIIYCKKYEKQTDKGGICLDKLK